MNAFHRTICGSLILAGLIGTAPAQAAEGLSSAAREINQANELLRSGDVDKALGAYRAVSQLAPESADLSYNMAVAQYRKGDVAAAESLFASAATSENDTLAARARYNLGNCDYASALQLAEKDRPTAIKRLESAIGNYRSALDVESHDADARANIELASRLIEKLREEQKQQEQQQKQQQQNQQQQQSQDKQQNKQNQQQEKQSQQNKQQQNDQQQQQNQSSSSGESQEQKSQQDKQSKQNQSQQDQSQQEKSQQNKNNEDHSQSDKEQSKNDQLKRDKSQSEQKEQDKKPSADKQKQQAPQSADQSQDRPSRQQQTQSSQHQQQKANQRSQQRDEPQAGNPEEEQHGKQAPQGELSTAKAADEKSDKEPKEKVAAFDPAKDGEMTQQEAEKMLQSIRDRDMLRRLQRQATERNQHLPVDRDW